MRKEREIAKFLLNWPHFKLASHSEPGRCSKLIPLLLSVCLLQRFPKSEHFVFLSQDPKHQFSPLLPLSPLIFSHAPHTHSLSGVHRTSKRPFWVDFKPLQANSPMWPSSDPQVKFIHPLPRETLEAHTNPNPGTPTPLAKKLIIIP